MWSINPFHSRLNTYLDLWIISSLMTLFLLYLTKG
nr:MAG TPA: hypothetical protein [Caudoviricetes sp.]